MNTKRKMITWLSRTARLLAACGLLLALASPAMALQPAARESAPDMPLVWTPATPIPYTWAGPGVQCPDDPGHYYLVGGMTAGWVDLDDVSRYDIQAGTWQTDTIADLPFPNRAPAVTCYQDKIYAAGGMSGGIVDWLYIYDISSNEWMAGAPLPNVNVGAALGAWDGKLYLVGGNATGAPWVPLSNVHVYDIATNTWTPDGGTPMPVASNFGGSIQVGPYLYVVGGLSGNYNNNLATTQRYDMSAAQWEQGPLFTSRRAMTGLAITEGYLYAMGGDANGGGGWVDATDYVERLDLSQWPGGAWTNINDPLPSPVIKPGGFCSELLAGGEIWSVGGSTTLDLNLYHGADQCLLGSFSFSLGPDSQSGSGYSGETVEYTLTVTNTGDIPDAYTFDIASAWTATASSLNPLWPGESAAITVSVEVPYTATLGASDTATITLTSQGDPAEQEVATLTTTAVTDWVDATAKAPTPVLGYGFAQCPEQPNIFYIFGGRTSDLGYTDEVWQYDADADSWTELAPMSAPVVGVAAVCYQGDIYVSGGADDYGVYDLFAVYHIATNTWTSGPSLPQHVFFAATGVWNGKLYLAGGAISGDPWPTTHHVEIYDLASQTWSNYPGSPMPFPALSAGYVQTGPYLWIVGGLSGSYDYTNRDSTQRYDMSSNTWTVRQDFTSQRAAFALAATGTHLYAIGGDENEGWAFEPTDLVEILDLHSWPNVSWESLGDPLPQPIVYNSAGFCSEVMSGGEVWSVAGATGAIPNPIVLGDTLYHPAEACLGYNYGVMLAPAALGGSGYPGVTVDYTLTVTNTGDTPDAYDVLVTSTWPASASALVGALDPGESVELLVSVQVPAGALAGELDVATLTVVSQGDGTVSASAILTTTALESPAYLAVGHLAPFATDPGTAVTVTVDGASVLTGFEFADSTGYLALSAGITHTIEIFANGVPTPAISSEVNLMGGLYYSGIAIGGANGWPLDLLALVDDDSAPAPGKFHLRLGHLAPFADTITGTLADIRLQDGAPVITGVAYGEATAFIPLDAGTYDLKITTPGGGTTLVDPLPVTFNAGDIVSAYAVGEAANQPLGVFAWPAGEPGFLLPLADFGVQVAPGSLVQSGYPGEMLVYTLLLTNTSSSLTDTFDLTYAGGEWQVHLPVTQTTLAPGASLQVEVHVSVPASAQDGDDDSVTFTATSQGDPNQHASATLTTTAAWRRVYMPLVSK